MSTENIDWTTVSRKARRQVKNCSESIQTVLPQKVISFDELCTVLNEVLRYYSKHIVAGFVYGSRARGTNRIDSDADVIIFWKHRVNIEDLRIIRAEMKKILQIDVDLVSCVIAKKFRDYNDQRDQAYFDGLIHEAKIFIGNELFFDLVQKSYKLPKLT
jgi:predicted nucleotidyltransferase